MRLCISSAFYPPHSGGVERYVSELSSALVKLGHEVIILTSNTENTNSIVQETGRIIYYFPVVPFIGGRLPQPKCNEEFRSMFAKLKNEKIDAVIVNMRFYWTSLAGRKLALKKDIPFYLIEHVTGHFSVGNKLFDFFGHIYEHFITKILKRKMEGAFGVSAACGRWLNHFGINSIGEIYNGIDPDYPAPEADIRRELNIPRESLLIAFAGRLIPEKGIGELCEAFAALNPKGGMFLLIAGDGPLEEELMGKYSAEEDNIHILGIRSHDYVMAMLEESEITVIPSNYPEGLPTLIMEAGITRNALIATPMGGTEEAVVHGENGIIIKEGSAGHILGALEFLATKPTIRQKYSENLYRTVSTRFNWHTIAGQLVEYIR